MTVNIFKMPEWAKRLPNDARITGKEMSAILGYSSVVDSKTINRKIGFPHGEQEIRRTHSSSPNKFAKRTWMVGDLRKIEGKEI